MTKVRVRYAPSPTGLLHIGNARTAIFNYLFSKHLGGDFIIRIEDTDVKRNVVGGEKSQLDNLKWLGLDWEESPDKGGNYGPYRQLERLDIYQKYANELLERGLAYKEYKEDSDAYAIRFKVPKDKTYAFDDLVRGTLKFESKEVEDWIMIKDNGIPTYNFAVVIDDHLMEITHVLRGEEHITNTPKQMMVYEAFGWEIPRFGHMTIIVNEQKKKLSKRDHSIVQFIGQYREMGYLPEALFNFITLLGWSPSINEEILTKEQIIELFESKRLSKAPAMFDVVKLQYINHQYMKKLSPEAFASFVKPFLVEAKIDIKSDEWLENLCSLLHDRTSYGKEIVSLYNEFFSDEFEIEAEAMAFLKENETTLQTIKSFKSILEQSSFLPDAIKEEIKAVGKDVGVKGKLLFMPVRIASTGVMHGPELPMALSLLGKEKVLNRITQTINLLEANQ
ncbi:Glutamyl-tRNA synthetase [Paracholeplasma brassicae]|uniref:Glutamate--tRNA ligase n=1 Tax=Acholeplasma brassicae TaxID=61635 RepID=U4KMH6_9MOLU|nr:glutamate--tRNA ligase [Paracholeplasma brassicae]CCV65310.1 Glutamyl-tRNA synthetase [Paracholeplasma brassicae]